MRQVTISLSDKENNIVEKLMVALDLKRHQVIKLAIRRFLFPIEESNIPLDGAYAQLVGIPMPVSEHPLEESQMGFKITKEKEKRVVIKK